MNRKARLTTILSRDRHGHGATLLFDLDGTLVDSAPDICLCVNDVMDYYGFPFVSEEYVRSWAGQGTSFLLRKLLNEYKSIRQGIILKKDFADAYNLFLSSYRENNGRFASLYPSVRESLVTLNDRDFSLGVVTNRPAEFTGSIVAQLGLDDLVDVIVCADEFGSYKPDPGMLLHAIGELGGAPELSVMTGDSLSDVMAAKNARIMSVYARYGYRSNVDTCELYADRTIDSLVELVYLTRA